MTQPQFRRAATLEVAMPSRFVLVTACRNAAGFIDETIASILMQSGDFAVRYHIQDGGSTDGTLERIERWCRLVESGGLPGGPAGGVEFTVASRRDDGLYDALDLAFRALRPDEGDWTGWLNASDRLQPGALATVAALGAVFPDIDWLGGRVARIDRAGSLVAVDDPIAYPRRSLAAGLHDGRHLPFLQQEGCFWRGRLWQRAGGCLARELRAAGDFDLWRRFAVHAPYTAVNSILGCFRSHAGQLSEALSRYHEEVDGLLAADRDVRDATWSAYRRLTDPKDMGGLASEGFMGPVVQFHEGRGCWQRVERPPFGIR